MAGQVDGKVAMVTGAATGIGAACARALAREGAVVVCTSLPTDPTQSVVDQILAAGGNAVVKPLNVTDPEWCQRVVEEVASELGALHILLNNAGLTDDGLFMRMKPESWRQVLSDNIDGPINAIAPGDIQTPMTDKLNEEQKKALMANLAIPRLGTPEDIAAVVLFLAGPAGSYITGEVINVSGGLYM